LRPAQNLAPGSLSSRMMTSGYPMNLLTAVRFLAALILLSVGDTISNLVRGRLARSYTWSLTVSSFPTRVASVLFTTGKSPGSWAVTLRGSYGPRFPEATGVGSVYTKPNGEVFIWSGAMWVRYEGSKACTTEGTCEQN
jgi:hypothetical protein